MIKFQKARDIKIGSRVEHINHGIGTVFSYESGTEDGIFVEFDVQPEGWDKLLCVSVGCLKLIKMA